MKHWIVLVFLIGCVSVPKDKTNEKVIRERRRSIHEAIRDTIRKAKDNHNREIIRNKKEEIDNE